MLFQGRFFNHGDDLHKNKQLQLGLRCRSSSLQLLRVPLEGAPHCLALLRCGCPGDYSLSKHELIQQMCIVSTMCLAVFGAEDTEMNKPWTVPSRDSV